MRRPGHRAAADDGLARAHVGALEVAVERLREAMRALRHGRRAARGASGHTGSSPLAPDACIARTGLERRDLHLVDADGARDRVAAQAFATSVGASDDDPGLRPAEQLVARARHQVGAVGERLGHGRLVGRHPLLVAQQARADVVEERHAVLRARARPGPWRAASR